MQFSWALFLHKLYGLGFSVVEILNDVGTRTERAYIHNNIIAVNDLPEQLPALHVDDIDHARFV